MLELNPRITVTSVNPIRLVLYLIAGLVCCQVHAGTVTLVSQDGNGDAGSSDSAHSFFFSSPNNTRRSQVNNDGIVFFLSQAPLDINDSNSVFIDFYKSSDPGATVIDLPDSVATPEIPSCPVADGNCFWAETNNPGSDWYLIRQQKDAPLEFVIELNSFRNFDCQPATIVNVDFAGATSIGVYEQIISSRNHIVIDDLRSPASPVRTELTVQAGANNSSFAPAISDDGTKVVFSSLAFNLLGTGGDTNALRDVFLWSDNQFTLISQRQDDSNIGTDAAGQAAISGDGKVIAFASRDRDFTGDDTNGKIDLFLYSNGNIQRVKEEGTEPNGDSESPRLNGDGRFLAFRSTATNLVDGIDNGLSQIYVFDVSTNRIECVSTSNTSGAPADNSCFSPEISPDGRYVTFVSDAENLGANADGKYQVFRVDRGAGFLNHAPTATGKIVSGAAQTEIRFFLGGDDADSDILTFTPNSLPSSGTLNDNTGSNAIVAGQIYSSNSFPWIYMSSGSGNESFQFTISDGIAESLPATINLRIVDTTNGSISRISVSTAGVEGTKDSFDFPQNFGNIGVSGNGNFVVFDSKAPELGTRNPSGILSDVFLRDTVNDTLTLVSFGFDAVEIQAGVPVISGDGSRIAYFTRDDVNGTEFLFNLILQDRVTGKRSVVDTITLTSNAAAPSPPRISRDGSLVAYVKSGNVLAFDSSPANSSPEIIDTGADPDISADGNVIAYVKNTDEIAVYYRHNNTIVTNVVEGTEPRLSATGKYLAYLYSPDGQDPNQLVFENIAAGTGGLRAITMTTVTNHEMSNDGRFFYYTAGATPQAFKHDRVTSTPFSPPRISHNTGVDADATSYRGALSADGHIAVFASDATDMIGANDTNGKRDVFLSDLGLPQNSLPVATLTSVGSNENVSKLIPLLYTDAEDNDVEVELVETPSGAASFSLIPAMIGQEFPTLEYMPKRNFFGTDTFSYRLRDGAGVWTNPQTVTITVQEVFEPVFTIPATPLFLSSGTAELEITEETISVQDPDGNASIEIEILNGPTLGVLKNTLGTDLTTTILPSDFNIRYIPTDNTTPATETITLVARDTNDPAGNDSNIVLLTIYIGVTATQNLSLVAGWNLISLAVTPTETKLSRLFMSSQTRCSVGPAWYWDASITRMTSVSTLEAKRGYWVYSNRACPILIPGLTIQGNDTIADFEADWNLLGPVGDGEERSFDTDFLQRVNGVVWNWNTIGQRFVVADKLRKGQGYWVFSNGSETTLDLRMD